MADDNLIYSMYNNKSTPETTVKHKADPVKAAARVLGGLRGQNSHTHTFESDGQLISVPRSEYIAALETQVRELRNQVRDLTTKQQRMVKANARVLEEIRQIKNELINKVDLR
jgi:hypothetical protein